MTAHPDLGGLAGMNALPRARKPLVPSALLGALIFVAAEVMFFSGIMSALTISRAGAAQGTWPPAGQPPLASAAGDASVAIVGASGALLVVASRLVARNAARASRVLFGSALLGATFVLLQVAHAGKLLSSGLTMTSSQQASFLFLLGGLQTVHAAVTVVAMLIGWRRLVRGTLSPGYFAAVQVFWYFVVLMWPVVYARVYA